MHCMEQANDDFKNCTMSSTNDKAFYDQCYENFSVAVEECPCNSKCETGCPCNSGYKCQENIMAMCQMQVSGYTNPVNYTYMISADGLYKVTIKIF